MSEAEAIEKIVQLADLLCGQANWLEGRGAEALRLVSRARAILGPDPEIEARIKELEKSQGYAPPVHWESHWDLGSMEEV